MASEGSAKKIERGRTPRVHISYDVDVNGKMVKTELPFIMGVMADLAGKSQSEAAQKDLADRKFTKFDVNNFDAKMKDLKPRVAFVVDNKMSEAGGKMSVDLTFESMDDFSPERVAERLDGVKELLASRKRLDALRTSIAGKAAVEKLLSETLSQAKEGDKSLLEALVARKDGKTPPPSE